MEGVEFKSSICAGSSCALGNSWLAKQVIEEAVVKGVSEFCVAPGSRNAPLVYALANTPCLKCYYWTEERSAAFFALGRIKSTRRPVAVVTTSGTAVGELLPATMEAYYSGLPLLLVTADRPRSYRGTGSPQTAEQKGIFGPYTYFMQDLADDEECSLKRWQCQGPAHLNVCFEEPSDQECKGIYPNISAPPSFFSPCQIASNEDKELFSQFFKNLYYPLVIVGALEPQSKEQVIQFLLQLKAPVYTEAISGIREDPRLEPWRITRIDKIWDESKKAHYPIDGVLRIGGVPTDRLWRDLEEKKREIPVCSVSEQPFSGLTRSLLIHVSLNHFFASFSPSFLKSYPYHNWVESNKRGYRALHELFAQEPASEPASLHFLSRIIPNGSHIYLGNSLPIREWDLAATLENREYQVTASRGLNGIDGQISTFLGMCEESHSNWAILGDLTALYDLAAPWILPQLASSLISIVIINNGGGKIFERLYSHKAFMNPHQLHFRSFAELWGLKYHCWNRVPSHLHLEGGYHLIEIVPDDSSTLQFWKTLATQ